MLSSSPTEPGLAGSDRLDFDKLSPGDKPALIGELPPSRDSCGMLGRHDWIGTGADSADC